MVKILTEMNLSTSSSTSIGALRYSTAFHSSQLRGITENTSCGEGQKGETSDQSTYFEERNIQDSSMQAHTEDYGGD